MNSIATDFLKIVKNGNIFNYEATVSKLAGKVEKFIAWLLSARDMQTRMKITDLYSYWLQEIDGK